jgi:hypothetical protein
MAQAEMTVEDHLFNALADLMEVLEKSFEPSETSLKNSGWVEGRQLSDAMHKARAALALAAIS